MSTLLSVTSETWMYTGSFMLMLVKRESPVCFKIKKKINK